jgi:hypothetical protein
MDGKAAMTVTTSVLLTKVAWGAKRWRSSSLKVHVFALLVLVTGVDLHGSSLSGWTYESPHPVFVTCGEASRQGHVEEAGTALAPGHEPILRRRPVVTKDLVDCHSANPDSDTGRPISASREDLPAAGHRLPPAPRGPPFV